MPQFQYQWKGLVPSIWNSSWQKSMFVKQSRACFCHRITHLAWLTRGQFWSSLSHYRLWLINISSRLFQICSAFFKKKCCFLLHSDRFKNQHHHRRIRFTRTSTFPIPLRFLCALDRVMLPCLKKEARAKVTDHQTHSKTTCKECARQLFVLFLAWLRIED